MEFQVNTNNVILAQINQVESGEYNVTECRFIFSSEYEGLTKIAVFTGANGDAYKITILNNKCEIPSELLTESQIVQIGVYAYEVQGTEFVLRYSPMPTRFMIEKGSYVVNAVNMSRPTPTEVEQLQSQITHNANDIEDLQQTVSEHTTDISNIQSDINDIKAEQTEQNTNIQKNTDDIVNINQAIDTINTDITDIDSAIGNINEDIDNLEQDLTNYSLITETGSQINLNVNSTNYQITAILKDKNGNVIYTSNAIDLPIESMIINASYDNTTKEIVLTLQNGNTLRISIADLVSGLVSETQLQTILANYYTKIEVDNLLSNLAERVSTNEEDIADIKEEQTTQNTNIEELQNQVETLQEDLESANSEIEELNTDITNMAKAMYKVDGQGSDITLENTSENKFVEFGLEGRTEQDGEPTPETPIPIKNVTGNANVKIQNKNLANINVIPSQSGYVAVRIINDTIKIYGNNNPVGYTPLNIKLKQLCPLLKVGDIVILSFKTTSNASNKNSIYLAEANILWNKETTKTITQSMLDSIVAVYGGNNETAVISEFQIEQGSTATSYVPHQEQNYPFTFAEGQRGMQGTQLLDDGIHNTWKQLTITEAMLDPTIVTSYSELDYIRIGVSRSYIGGGRINVSLMSCANENKTWEFNDKKYIGTYTNRINYNYFYIGIPKGTSYDDIKNEIIGQVIEYKLADSELESNIIPYNETQQAQYNAIKQARSYDDQTNISSTSDELGFNMDVVAVANANKVIDKELQEIKSAVIALGGDINV